MQIVNTGKNRALAFILGLVYGYRKAHFELKVLNIEDFAEKNHLEDRVYYINRQKGEVYDCYGEGTTHICEIREDKTGGKVVLFVYRRGNR